MQGQTSLRNHMDYERPSIYLFLVVISAWKDGIIEDLSLNEYLADQPRLPANERQPIEMYHQLI